MKHGRFAAFYAKKLAQGKPKKLALIALVRKIIVTINAIEKNKTIYQP